jgi:hypothetical protein
MHNILGQITPETITPGIILWRTTVEALLAVMSEKKAQALMRSMAYSLADAEAMAEVRPLRQTEKQRAEADAVREAAALFRAATPVLLARIDRT